MTDTRSSQQGGMRGIASPCQNVGGRGCIPHPPAVDASESTNVTDRQTLAHRMTAKAAPYFIYCFLNAVWALVSGGFRRIVSDTLVCFAIQCQ